MKTPKTVNTVGPILYHVIT